MFKNFQEHFEKSEESRFGSDFLGFNPKYERIKLLLSAILIPVGCSFFYFLHTGHKYADLESAIGSIESAKVDINRDLILATSTSDSADDSPFLQSKTTIVFDDETDETNGRNNSQSSTTGKSTTIMAIKSDLSQIAQEASTADSDTMVSEDSKAPSSAIQTIQNPGRNLTELAGFLIKDSERSTADTPVDLNAGRSQTELALLITGGDFIADNGSSQINENTSNDRQSGVKQTSDDKIDQDIAIIASSQFSQSPVEALDSVDHEIQSVKPVSAQESGQAKITSSDQPLSIETTSSELEIASTNDDIKSTNGLSERASRIILVDKIIGLLKSEVINTHSTAATGKLRVTNRHAHTNKKSLDVNKLESMLEDI